MKKLILSGLAIVALAFGVLAFMPSPEPIAEKALFVAAAMPLVVDSPPYTPDCPCVNDPGYPVPFCGTCETNEREAPYECKFECSMTLVLARNDACAAYHACKDAANDASQQQRALIFATYQACLNSGSNPVDCKAARDTALGQLRASFNASMAACTDTICAANSAAEDAWLACMQACCLNCIIPDPTMTQE